MFHFHVSTCWLSTHSRDETYGFNVSLLVSMFHFKKHCGSDLKTLRERFKNTVGAIQKHCGSAQSLSQRFEKWNMKLKMKHRRQMFHHSKTIDNQTFYKEKWNMKDKVRQYKSLRTTCKRIRDAALSTFIHHYTFAAKSKSIKYDSRRTIRVGMETIPCTTQ